MVSQLLAEEAFERAVTFSHDLMWPGTLVVVILIGV